MKKILILIILIILLSGCIDIPPQETCIQKMVICYSGRYDDPGVKEYISEHFDLDDTEVSSYSYSYVQWMKENAVSPTFKVIGYFDAIGVYSTNHYYSEVNQHEDWFMHNKSGDRIKNSVWGWYLMNPNSGWVDWVVSHLNERLQQFPDSDGFFIDDFPYNLQSMSYGPYDFDTPYSDFGDGYSIANWKAGMTNYATALKENVNGLCMLNCHRDTLVGEITGYAFWENWQHGRTTTHLGNGYTFTNGWNGGLLAIDILHNTALNGSAIAVNSGCSGWPLYQQEIEEWAKYCYATLAFAMVDPAKTYFSWQFMSANNAGAPVWYPFMDMEIGYPIDDYYNLQGNTYIRPFSNYYIIINFDNLGTHNTFVFEGEHYTLEGKHTLFIERL